jgi:DNA polymerase III delta prime subunit
MSSDACWRARVGRGVSRPAPLALYPLNLRSQITKVLSHIAKKEKFHLPSEVATRIADESGGNLRKAILVFEALKMQS